MTEINYLLAIDGGGTKTDFLLTDLSGNEIKRIILGPSNPVSTGLENMKKCLYKGINHVCHNLDKTEISVFAGIAGGMSGNNKEIISDYLSSFGFAKHLNGSDTDSALEVALGGGKGIALILGTGISAFVDTGSNRHKVSGWGYLIDKGGSGFHFGSDALDSAFRFLDGRGGSELIYRLVEEKLEKPLSESVSDIYKGGNSYIASFSPVIFSAYLQGDKEAEKIIDKNACEIADIISTGYGILKDKKSRIVICGGLCKQKEILENFLANHLTEEIKIEWCDKAIVQGALSLARKNINK